jgi:hypothetical protein
MVLLPHSALILHYLPRHVIFNDIQRKLLLYLTAVVNAKGRGGLQKFIGTKFEKCVLLPLTCVGLHLSIQCELQTIFVYS